MIYQSLLLASGLAATLAQQELLVKTTAGNVQGHYAPQNVREWNGIPYATPPGMFYGHLDQNRLDCITFLILAPDIHNHAIQPLMND